MTIHQLKGFGTKLATADSDFRSSPADRIRSELRALGLGTWVNEAPGAWLTNDSKELRMHARNELLAKCEGAQDYASRISADEGRIARERFRDLIDCLESMS